MSTQHKFRLGMKEGKRLILAPDGSPILHYYSLDWGRLGAMREFNRESKTWPGFFLT